MPIFWRGYVVWAARMIGLNMCLRQTVLPDGTMSPYRLAFHTDDDCKPIIFRRPF
jgi:hypothetical protein